MFNDVTSSYKKMRRCENIWFDLLGKRLKVIIGIVYRHPQYNIDESCQSFSETVAQTAKNNCAYYVLDDILLNATTYATNDIYLMQQMIAECNSI